MNKITIRYKEEKQKAIWLNIICLLIVTMILIGGLTRLTGSGLSITEWKPVTGIIPPLSSESWQGEFNKYKGSPEYRKINFTISLNEFQYIYLMEFAHRAIGRILAVAYILPFFYYLFTGRFNRNEITVYSCGVILLAGQGLMGWYMVKSGLADNPHVCHFRLATHLLLAVILYVIILWQRFKISDSFILLPGGSLPTKALFWGKLSLALLFLQIILGAFVAGLDAGLVYNSFPLMGEGFIPREVTIASINARSLSDPVFIQFTHRIIAYLLSLVIVIFAIKSIQLKNNKLLIAVSYISAALILQLILGVITILYQVPLEFALAHQMGAVMLLTYLVRSYFLLKTADINEF